jgi:AraC-like DNA-binding protein
MLPSKDLFVTGLTVKRTIAFARLPRLIRSVAREFQRLSGLTAVTTFGSASADSHAGCVPLPPVHPLCARLLRETPGNPPCEAEWRKHLKVAGEMPGCRMHTCPLGLRCASLPIALDDRLLGLAKLVSGTEIPKERFSSFVGLLEALIARPCQEFQVSVLREDVEILKSTVDRLRQAKRPLGLDGTTFEKPPTRALADHDSPQAQTLISQILDYLGKHYADSELSLVQVAGAMGRNDKYIAHLFVRHLGERMRPYITSLRVRRACELLLQTGWTIDQVGRESGFANSAQFRQSFRSNIGVTASEYRQIFTTAV